MNWQTTDLSSYEVSPTTNHKIQNKNDSILKENEHKRRVQLKKLKKHPTDENKTIYNTVMSQFAKLLIHNNKEEITNTILTDDCEIFLFNFTDTAPAQYGFRHEGFVKLFEDKKVIRREVKDSFICQKRATAFQVCDCEVIDENRELSISQFSFEIFSFRDSKVSKYRVCYGSMPMKYNPQSLFIPTKKERMLAKVKEINFAWADQPDLERIASLLPEGAEYKVYRWNDNKCFTFDKQNLVPEFKRSLEEKFVITSVVPYGISCEAQYVVGSYVYHLESKCDFSGLSSERFIWVNTCMYAFDQNFSIKKMSQQGELYPEGQIAIPFQVQSQEEQKTQYFNPPKVDPNKSLSIFDTERVNFSFDLITFGPLSSQFTGHIKGLSQFDNLDRFLTVIDGFTEKTGKVIDVYEDLDDPCYDSMVVIESAKGKVDREGHKYNGMTINLYVINKFSFENGKLAKTLAFYSSVIDPIPSPFDNVSFNDLNFRPKSEFI